MNIIKQIEDKLTQSFQPSSLRVIDESEFHIGHAGAKSGGHYAIEITAATFADKNLVERHRLIYQALDPLMKSAIHALKIKAKAPGE